MLTIWLKENNTTSWTKGLPVIQYAKNIRFHTGIGQSPYEALFGRLPLANLKNFEENVNKTSNEEDNSNKESFTETNGSAVEDNSCDEINEDEILNKKYFQEQQTKIDLLRQLAREKLKKQAETMVKSSINRYFFKIFLIIIIFKDFLN